MIKTQSERYINYQNHTKYCPGNRLLLSQENGGENIVLISDPNHGFGVNQPVHTGTGI